MKNEVTGTALLVRLALRRDRIVLPIWIVLVSLIPVALARSYAALYPTTQALVEYANASANTPVTFAGLGFVYSATVGGLTAWRSGIQSALLIGIASMLFVIRYTRSEEELGRRELLGASVVGRNAPLAAALIVVLGANALIAALMTIGLISAGLPAAGAAALGLSAACAGGVCAALGAVCAQLAESAGTARGLALATFGGAYLLRFIGDAGGPSGTLAWVSWLSPLGWMRLTRAFASEQWWVFLLFAVLIALLVIVAYRLSAQRDYGAGMLPSRLGPAHAAAWLGSPAALVWRLQHGNLLAWSLGALVFGGLLGAVGQSIGSFMNVPQANAWAQRMGGHTAGDAFLYLVMYVLGQVVAAYALTSALRMYTEEMAGMADPLLSSPVSRLRWASSHVLFTLVGPTIVLTAFGLAIGLSYSLSAQNIDELPRLFGRTLVTLPAIWVMVGIAIALYGLLPRLAAAASWALFMFFLALELGWELQQISPALFAISPFSYVHWATPLNALAMIGLLGVAAAGLSIGLFGFQRRDIG